MKKLSKILAVLLLALACVAVFAACNPDDDGQRTGEKCYVENVFNKEYGVNIQYLTQYKNHPWAGAEKVDEFTDSFKTYFIKGDVVDIKVACRLDNYYPGSNFGLTINGTPIALTKTPGNAGEDDLSMIYYTCSYTIQSDIEVDIVGIEEKTVNFTISAQTRDEMMEGFFFDTNAPMSEEEQKEAFLAENYFGDDANIYVRFEHPSRFGLAKAEWRLNELKNYVLAQGEIAGKVGVVRCESLYIYSKGYDTKCTNPFELSEMDGAAVVPECYCYFDEEANEYGFKIVVRPGTKYNEETGEWEYVDGRAKINTHNDLTRTSIIRGSLQNIYPSKDEEYLLENDIAEVPCDNPIFSVQFGEQKVGDWLDINSFREDGKLDVTVRLKKYSDPQWKALYDQMTIKVIDTTLRKGVDYTISAGGVITLVLDKPYTYYDTTKLAPDIFEDTGIPAAYTYGYEFYFNIVKLARDAGLVVTADVQDPFYGGNGGLKVYFGDDLLTFNGQAYVPTNFYYDEMVGLIRGGNIEHVIRKALYVKGTYLTTLVVGTEAQTVRYTKATVTDEGGRTFVIDVVPYVPNEDKSDQDVLAQIVCEQGKEVAVVRTTYKYYDDNGNEVTEYQYWMKALADLNIKKIEFHN